MKRTILVLLALVLVSCSASAAFGQAFEFGPKIGYSIATGDFGDVADDGFAYGLFTAFYVNSLTTLELAFLRHVHDTGAGAGSFPGNPDDLLDDFESIDDGDLKINEFTISGVHRFSTGKVKPYITGGGGVYLTTLELRGKREEVQTTTSTDTATGTEVTTTLTDFSADDTLTDFGIRGGGGVSILLTGELSLGVEAVYTYVFGDFDDGFMNLLANLSYGF